MLIDWFTVGAQAINFLILVWLMQHFLYKPILNAIDRREEHIAKKLADAKSKEIEANQERDEFKHKNEVFDQECAALRSKMIEEVKVERERLLDEARQAVSSKAARQQEALRNEAKNLSQVITHRIQNNVLSITRKALMDLAGVGLEERMHEVFMQQLRGLTDQARKEISTALSASVEPMLVRSVFTLSPEQQSKVHAVLEEVLSTDIQLCFKTAPELISGIELTANGYRVAWSISDYLISLEKDVGELLQKKEAADRKVEVQHG